MVSSFTESKTARSLAMLSGTLQEAGSPFDCDWILERYVRVEAFPLGGLAWRPAMRQQLPHETRFVRGQALQDGL